MSRERLEDLHEAGHHEGAKLAVSYPNVFSGRPQHLGKRHLVRHTARLYNLLVCFFRQLRGELADFLGKAPPRRGMEMPLPLHGSEIRHLQVTIVIKKDGRVILFFFIQRSFERKSKVITRVLAPNRRGTLLSTGRCPPCGDCIGTPVP